MCRAGLASPEQSALSTPIRSTSQGRLLLHVQLLKSRLILLGIANSLDLTERLLPGLEARGCKPRLVAFPTYSRNQITAVLQERLDSLPGPVFAAKALEFCARKVGCLLCGLTDTVWASADEGVGERWG